MAKNPANTTLPPDDVLLTLLGELGTQQAIAEAAGHTNRDHVRGHLRSLGIYTGKRKPENRKLPSDAELLELWRQYGTISGVARATGHTNRDWVRQALRRLGVVPWSYDDHGRTA